ncbi:cystathionine beta-lyase PatB [Lapidilactobacillus dextrinicus DSM 20335]|uniref:cysteine-S-conjugate beta-lyase n=1 Tax=Lapidilactobacillus dextrinicus DSM 20335 TaxID=1423738 RepID=A0A0R2BQH7_9LACO|nr:MalY/PatB family protein [Lapidilactobacillus dextrinicus]KRM78395.1 cystathionine beta-lyase PatB [Lapidilactobacillus dextrinicus DSM 20335]QFG46558.1 pyridoxal phosphate-dependent aminotransferase [Lapidilactobacillus dextrinicus]
MTYDFKSITNRRQTNSIKWQIGESELPMWIADMDFKTAPEIIEALHQKIELGIFGYEAPNSEYFEAVSHWYQSEHHTTSKTDWLLFTTGVIPALSAIIRQVSHVGDNIVVQTPVYNMFFNSIENNGRHVVTNELIYQPETGNYKLDFTDLESKLADPLTTMMILCNPHNPIGKVWTKDDLRQIATLCQEHHVILVSDEIHGDLVLNGPDYTPLFALAADFSNTITLVSPSKTFNIAAIHAATVIVPDQILRQQVARGLNITGLAKPNLLAIPGTIAAYTQGHEWLKELKQQLRKNQNTVQEFITQNLPQITITPTKATYLLWLDCRQITNNSQQLAEFIRQETGLILNAGDIYRGNGHDFLRMNIACPPSLLQDGLKRFRQGIQDFQNQA